MMSTLPDARVRVWRNLLQLREPFTSPALILAAFTNGCCVEHRGQLAQRRKSALVARRQSLSPSRCNRDGLNLHGSGSARRNLPAMAVPGSFAQITWKSLAASTGLLASVAK